MNLLRLTLGLIIIATTLLAEAAKPAPWPKTERQLIVIDAGQVDAANAAAVAIAGPAAADTFTVPFRDAGNTKAYFVASWVMTAEQRQAFKTALGSNIADGKAAIHHTKSAGVKSGRAKLHELELLPVSTDHKTVTIADQGSNLVIPAEPGQRCTVYAVTAETPSGSPVKIHLATSKADLVGSSDKTRASWRGWAETPIGEPVNVVLSAAQPVIVNITYSLR